MPTRPDELPEWAVPANYNDPGEDWDGQPNLDDAAMETFANEGYTPNQPTPAPEQNSYDRRKWQWVRYLAMAFVAILAGDGSDGDVTIAAGTTTLARDMYYDRLTVEAGATLNTAGFRVFARTRITVEATGVIRPYANAGSNGTGAGGGAGGAVPSAGTVGVGAAGGAGGDDGVNGADGTDLGSNAIGGAGGDGGDNGGASFTGGTGGSVTVPTAVNGSRGVMRAIPYALTGHNVGGTILSGGAGGAGGAGAGAGTRGGGGGGAGGGILVLVSPEIVNDGDIIADGGAGGDGAGDILGSGGGGGGGGGGAAVVIVSEYSGSGTLTADGGVGGAGGDNGFTAGEDGEDGDDGLVIQIDAATAA